MLKIFRLSLLLLISASLAVFSQGVSQTPYSQFGIGDIENQTNTRQQGMGGVGVSLPNNVYGNPINPALTAYNRSHVIFDAGFYGQTDNIRSATQSQRITNGNVNYFSLLFPISTKNWTVTIGLNPYSNANTRFQGTRTVANDTSKIQDFNTFEGGLNQIYMSHGIRLPKGFSIGVSINYIFGSITRTTRSNLNYYNQSSQTLAISKEQYKILEFKPGLAYNRKLNEDFSLNFGATATFSANVNSTRKISNSIVYEQPSASTTQPSSTYIPIYTNASDSNSANISLPSQYKIGASLNKSRQWNMAVDYTFGNWQNYSGFTQTNVFQNSHRIAIGGEYIPNYNTANRNIIGYIEKTIYRFGAYYYVTPLNIKGTRIDEIAGTFGLGLPFGKGGGLTSLNLAVMVGRRGTTDNGLIQENFVRFFVGLNINDRWFIRYKLD
jgi:hypothetical protein